MYCKFYIALFCLVFHFFRTNGLYFNGTINHQCHEKEDALEDAVKKLGTFYTSSSFDTTMHVPSRNTLKVDNEEYVNIRNFCNKFRSKFQNILDFKFMSTYVRFSTGHLSTCPWVFVDDYDEDRLPKIISQARCVCSRCLQKTENSREDVQYVPRLGRCKPVMTSVMTLRRKCNQDSGSYEYLSKSERISVGCTCTSPVRV